MRSSSISEPRRRWKPLAQFPPLAAMRDLNAWHTDTFVNGPSWPEFSKAMGIAEGTTANTGGSVYVVSVYRAAPGHRDQLEQSLQTPPGDKSSGNVVMQHLEGGPWHYLTLVRYNSWEDFAASEKTSVANTLKPDGGWLGLRNHSSYHNDTVADRIAPEFPCLGNAMRERSSGQAYRGLTDVRQGRATMSFCFWQGQSLMRTGSAEATKAIQSQRANLY